MDHDTYRVDLSDAACERLDLAGGKAVNLARLARMGMPVPPGFCITTHGYRAFVRANSIGGVIEKSLSELDAAAAAGRIRAAFTAGAIPPELAAEIAEGYQGLGGRVAARSSATSEDQKHGSSAGNQATVLNVEGLPALFHAVRECWASLWTQRAMVYRRQLQIAESSVALAVFVQRMVDARLSGVLFTVEPVTGDRKLLVLEACRGLGEALVSGAATPDRYVVDRATLELHEERLASDDSIRLDRVRLQTLVRMALAIEAHFGAPQDIEWSIDQEGQVHILQARPVTTLVDKPSPAPPHVNWDSPIPGAHWIRLGGGMTVYLPGPVSPLYSTAQLPAIFRLLDAQHVQMGVRSLEPSYALINGFFYARQGCHTGLGAILWPFHYFKESRRRARWWRERALPAQLAQLSLLSEVDLREASAKQLLAHVETILAFNAAAWDTAVRTSVAWIFGELLFRGVLDWFVRPLKDVDPIVFLRGFASQTMAGERERQVLIQHASESSEIIACLTQHSAAEALEQLARLPSGSRWLEELERFARTYGHAAARHDYLHPSPADDLTASIQAIQTSLAVGGSGIAERQQLVAREREKATSQAMEALARAPLRRALFRRALAWAQEGASIREDVFFHALRGWPLARGAILEQGRRMTRAGVLAAPEDVFFLMWDELREILEQPDAPATHWRQLVAKRRQEYETRSRLLPPPRVPAQGTPLGLPGRLKMKLKRLLVGAPVENDADHLHGSPASPGTVTGPARIIHSTAEFGRLRAGDVLVAQATTPEWIPAFAVVAAVVTDSGGPLSHSSIVAREFGIPAVMGVLVATRTIMEGQLISVNGSLGLVTLL
jgi:pyruvate,water dikinase